MKNLNQFKKVILLIRRNRYVKKSIKSFFKIASRLPKRKNTIVFESFSGKQFSDNPKALYLYIKENYPQYKLYWSFDRKVAKNLRHKDLHALSRFGLKWIMIMARAEYWITNSRLPLWIPKPRGTTYVQTWHGTPLKKLAADMDEVHMPGTNTERYKRNFLKEANKWDYLVSANEYSTTIFKRAFQFKETIIESGYPRNDILINFNNNEKISELKRKAKLPLDKNVILYAPTWRDNLFYTRGRYKFNLELDLQKMQENFGKDYILILRLHYLVSDNLDLTGFENFVYDVSSYEDINELYLMSDMLITDYSSVFFDYANLKRPMFFYVYDIDEYRDKLRGFYYDFEKKAPGPLVKETDELIKEIKKVEQNNNKPMVNETSFSNKFCYLDDGRASERVVNEILK